MTNVPRNADNFCYRHPDRQSFILCQRCGRTICTQCQTPAAVGVHCPECVREQRGSMPRVKPRVVTNVTSIAQSGGPVVSYALMGVTVLGYIVGLFAFQYLGFAGYLVASQPWRILTGMFVYASPLSIISVAFTVYMLWAFGSTIESQLGRVRYIVLYLMGALGAELAASLFLPFNGVQIAGATMFGLFGAFYVILRMQGQQANQILVLIALNLVIGLVLGSLAFVTLYIGAAAIGALTALIFGRTAHRSQVNLQRGLTIGLAVVLVAVLIARATV